MDRFKQLEDKHARERAELEQQESVRAALPESIRERAHIHRGAYGESWIKVGDSFRCETSLADAAALLLSLGEPLECQHLKSGTLKIVPEILTTEKDESYIIDGASAVTIELEGGKNYGPNFALVAWFDLGEHHDRAHKRTCKVSIAFRGKHNWIPTDEYQGEGKYRRRTGRKLWRGHGEDKLIRWWSGDNSYRGTFCWADLHNFKAWLSHELENP